MLRDEDRGAHHVASRPIEDRSARKDATISAPENRARYGGPWFQAASSLQLDAGLGRPHRLAAVLLAAALQPKRFLALFALLLRTPSDLVYLSDSDAGRALRRHLNERFLGVFPQNRLCRGVLLLPPDHANYLRGRRRQALRTNLRHAADAGVLCEVVTDPAQALGAVTEVIVDRAKPPDDLVKLTASWLSLFSAREMTMLLARGRDGRPLAFTAAVIDRDVCLIRVAVACDHNARWALHDHLVQILIARGVRYLLAEGDGPFGALGFEAELHHYQHLLGYELRHLIPDKKPLAATQ